MNYVDVLNIVDERPPHKGERVNGPLMKEVPPVQSFGDFFTEKIVYNLYAGALFGVGHFIGIKLIQKLCRE
jgi:hypothetical protein